MPQNLGSSPAVTRRGVLGLAAGAILVVGFHVPAWGVEPDGSRVVAANAFIKLHQDGKVTLVIPQVEMGQGIYTSLAMVLADELDRTGPR